MSHGHYVFSHKTLNFYINLLIGIMEAGLKRPIATIANLISRNLTGNFCLTGDSQPVSLSDGDSWSLCNREKTQEANIRIITPGSTSPSHPSNGVAGGK